MCIQVVMSGNEIDADGFIDEDHLRAGYQDLLMAEEKIFGRTRAWRNYRGCYFFQDLQRCGIERVTEEGILHTEKITAHGKTKEVTKAPAAAQSSGSP